MPFYKELTTPVGLLGFANLVRESKSFGGYNMQLFLDPKDKDVQAFLEQLTAAQVESVAREKKDNPKANKVRDINIAKVSEKDPENMQGKDLIRLTIKSKMAPKLLDKDGLFMTREREIPIGSEVQVNILTRSYTFAGTSGMSLYIRDVKLINEAEPQTTAATNSADLSLDDNIGL